MIQKVTSVIELKESILLLEIKQANETRLLKEEVKTIFENLSPVNIVKNTLKELACVPDLKGNLVNTGLGFAVGYVSKKIVVGTTHKPLRQLLGTLLQIGVSNLVAKNPEIIKSGVHTLASLFSKNRKTNEEISKGIIITKQTQL